MLWDTEAVALRGDGLLNHDLMPGEKGPQDECGVFGVWAPGEEVAKLAYFGLYALQHRGQESAGIATSNGQQILVYKDMGLVSQVFDETGLNALGGHIAVGHCRYSTTGGSTWENAQPTLGGHEDGTVALAHWRGGRWVVVSLWGGEVPLPGGLPWRELNEKRLDP